MRKFHEAARAEIKEVYREISTRAFVKSFDGETITYMDGKQCDILHYHLYDFGGEKHVPSVLVRQAALEYPYQTFKKDENL